MAFWVTLAIYAGSLILGEALKALRPKPKPTPFAYPTAEEDAPIPFGFGTFVVAPNIIAWGDTDTDGIHDHQTAYYARMLGGLCDGPVDELVDIIVGGNSLRLHPTTRTSYGDDDIVDDDTNIATVVYPSIPLAKPGGGAVSTLYTVALNILGGPDDHHLSGIAGVMRMHWGDGDATIDALTTHLLGADKAAAWPGLAYITFGGDPGTAWPVSVLSNGQFYWGLAPNLPKIEVMLRRFPSALLGSVAASRVGDHANAAEVVYELLTHVRHGAGVSPDLIDVDAFVAAATVLADEPEMGISGLVDQSRATHDVIDDVLRHVDATMFRHPATGLISMRVMRDTDAVELALTASNTRNPVLTPATVDDTTNEVRVAYRRLEGSRSGAQSDTITLDLSHRMGFPAPFLLYKLTGRDVSAVSVYNETQAVLVDPAHWNLFDSVNGTLVITPSGDAQIGDELTVSYTATPNTVGFRDAVTDPEHDVANIELTGSVRADTIDLPLFSDEVSAKKAGLRALRKLSARVEPLTLAVNREGSALTPGSVVSVMFDHLQLDTARFRVSRVRWGALEDGWISVEAVRDVFGTSEPLAGVPSGGTGTGPLPSPTAPAIYLTQVADSAIRIGLFPADQTFTITLERADDLAFTTAVTGLSSTLPGTTAYYDDAQTPPDVRYYRAKLTRVGYLDGPYSAVLTATAVAGTPGAPVCVLPTYTSAVDLGAGTVTLALTDPQVRVIEVRFRRRSGNGAWSVWAADTSPYVGTVTLDGGADSRIEWELDYAECSGETATYEGAAVFPVNPTVTTVFGRTGAVAAVAGDYTQDKVPATVVSKTATYTATATDNVMLADATSGAITINLPAAAAHAGRIYEVKKTDASANAVTLDGNAAETIDGASTLALSAQWASVRIISNGTAWFTIAKDAGGGSGNSPRIVAIADGAGSPLTVGIKNVVRVPAGTLAAWFVDLPANGSASFGVKAGANRAALTSITGGVNPAVASSTAATSSSLGGWSAFSANDLVEIEVLSIDGATTRATLTLVYS